MVKFLLKLFKYNKLLLVIYTIAILACAYAALQLSFDHNRNRFFPGDNDDIDFTTRYFSEIEQDDVYIFVGIENKKGVLDSSFLAQIYEFEEKCKSLPLVVNTISLVSYQYLKRAGLGMYQMPALQYNKPQYYATDSAKLYRYEGVVNNLVSADFKTVNIIIKTEKLSTQSKADGVYDELVKLIKTYNFDEYHTAGLPVMQSEVVKVLATEMRFYVALSFVLLLLVLVIVYRSVWGLIIPIAAVSGGLAFFFGYMQVSGQNLDLMSTLFPVLMLIFCMSDVVHLQTHYIDELEGGKKPLDALRNSLKEIGLALFLTSLTTAVGFGTLVTSKIAALKDFGFNAAIGVMIAYFIVIIFSASALLFFKKGQLSKVKGQQASWKSAMNKLYLFNKTRWRTIMGITLAILLLAAWGISLISTNAYIKGDVPKNSKLSNDFEFFEKNFTGVRTLEIATLPQGNYKTDDFLVLQEILKLEDYLKLNQGITEISSPTLPYKMMHSAFSRYKNREQLPSDESNYLRYRTLIESEAPEILKNFMSQDKKLGRISARQKDGGSDYHEEQNALMKQWIAKNIDSEVVQFRVTGTSLMYDRNHEYLRMSLFNSLGLAFIIVGLLFALLFRDWRMVFVSIVPNVIPLLISAAAMGFLEIKLQALTSIFFTISFGIAVDDTIHFLTRFKLERRKGKTVDKAISETLQVSGKAIILTSIILIISFVTLTFSDFRGTFYIGVLVSITLFTAVLADLFLLPQLLYLVNRQRIFTRRKNAQAK